MKKNISFVALLALVALALSACGGGGNAQSSAAEKSNAENPTALTIGAKNFEFDQTEYRVAAGEPIHFAINNTDGYHGFEIRKLGIKVDPGEGEQYTISEAGTYEILCSIPACGTGHRDMKATLIVE